MLKLILIFAAQILAAPPAPEDAAAYNIAKQHFNEGRHHEAANRFEELWERSPKPKYLHYAAMAWAAQGRDTHAIVDWQRVVEAPEASAKLRASANDFLTEAYKRASAVTVKIAANNAPAEARTITLTPAHGPPIEGSLADFQKPDSPETVIHLAPGTWTIGLQGQGKYKPASATITVEKGVPASVELAPQPVPGRIAFALQPPIKGANAVFRVVSGEKPPVQFQLVNGRAVELPERRWAVTIHAQGYHPYTRQVVSVAGESVRLEVRLTAVGPVRGPVPEPKVEKRVPHPKLALGLGIGAGVAAVAGGVLVGVGESQVQEVSEGLYEIKSIQKPSDRFALGSVFLGGSVGLGISAIVARVGIPRKRWTVPLVAGALTAVGGAVWYGVTTANQISDFNNTSDGIIRGVNDGTVMDPPTDMRELRVNIYGSTILMGLGTGLLVGSVSALVGLQKTKPTSKPLSVRFFTRGGTWGVSF